MLKIWSLFLFLLLLTVHAAPGTSQLPKRALPIPPSQDPFYTPDAGYESKKVGTILRQRQMTTLYGFIVIPEKLKAVYQFLVRSEDALGQPNAIVTTLLVPFNADPTKLLSFQQAQDTPYVNCAPSYSLQLGAKAETYLTGQVEYLLAQAPLNEGFYVVIPDHEGPKGGFTVGLQAGQAVLNSIRGVLQSGATTGLHSDASVALWGYSGGSLGTTWGASIHPTYAPEIKLVGSSAGGVIVNISSIAQYNIGKITAGLVFSSINALANQYVELQNLLKQIVFPNKVKTFSLPQTSCLIEIVPAFLFARFTDYFTLGNSALTHPVVKNVTQRNDLLLLNRFPTTPLFLHHGVFDEILPYSDVEAFYSRLCQNGAKVQLMAGVFSEHGLEAILGAGNAWEFVKDRLNGVPAPAQCNKKTSLANILNPVGLAGLGEIIADNIKTFLFQPVGPYGFI